MTKQNRKSLYLFDQSDWQSRMPVAELARAEGYEVTIALIGPEDNPAKMPEGFDTAYIKTSQKMSVVSLPQMVRQIRSLIKEKQPDLIHAVTLKYGFITGLAALPFKDLRKVYTLAGLGYLFRGTGTKAALIKSLLSPALKHVLKAPNTHLIFQNPDDLNLMIEQGYAEKERSTLIRGSGVDLDKFTAGPEPENESPLVLMPTRLVHEKGVSVFIEAAHILKRRGVNARFQIAGGETKHNPKAISRAEMEEMTKDGAVEWLGRVEDMPALLAQAALIVYPSYYGEGIPRVLLEAAAAGKAIITTDHPGCREAVLHNHNGLLVPTKDAKATSEAIERILSDKDLRMKMGELSRARAESEFDISIITEETLKVYKT